MMASQVILEVWTTRVGTWALTRKPDVMQVIEDRPPDSATTSPRL